jgi:ribosomal protein L37E
MPSITCPRCGATSYHPADIAHGYCGRCHAFAEDDRILVPEGCPCDFRFEGVPPSPQPCRKCGREIGSWLACPDGPDKRMRDLAPGFWMHESTGVLRPAVEAYLSGGPMTEGQIVAMRAYLRQWIMAPGWHQDPDLEELRRGIGHLTSRAALKQWLDRAVDAGIDPL